MLTVLYLCSQSGAVRCVSHLCSPHDGVHESGDGNSYRYNTTHAFTLKIIRTDHVQRRFVFESEHLNTVKLDPSASHPHWTAYDNIPTIYT